MFWRPGFETSPMLGPGFETFPTQFHFNISQMRQPSFQESALTRLSNQIDWKDFNEKLRFFSPGLSRRTTMCWRSYHMTFRSFWRSLTRKMWPWDTTSGCAPATLRSQAEGCNARYRTSRRCLFSFKTFLLLSCVQNYVPTIVALTYSKYITSDKYAPCLAQICDLPLWQT